MPDWLITIIVTLAGTGSVWTGLEWYSKRKLGINADERQVVAERTADWKTFTDGLLERVDALEDRVGGLEHDLYLERSYSTELLVWGQAGAVPPPPSHPKYRVVE